MIFFRAANEGERMFDHLKFCIGVIFFVAYTQTIVPILACRFHNCSEQYFFLLTQFNINRSFHFHPSISAFIDPSEVKLLKKECFNRWYSLMPYYTALTLSRIPFQVFWRSSTSHWSALQNSSLIHNFDFFADIIQFDLFRINLLHERIAEWVFSIWSICGRRPYGFVCGWRHGIGYWCHIQYNGSLHFSLDFYHIIASLIESFGFLFATERKRCGSIADSPVAWFGDLRFRFCQRHSDVHVRHYEGIFCACRSRITGVNRIRLWSRTIDMSRCLLSLWRSEGVAAIFAHRKSVPLERDWLSVHVCGHFSYDFVFVVETTRPKLVD